MLDLKDITCGEKLLIERRRLHESQRAAAKRHGVSRYIYRRWELDEEAGPSTALQVLEFYEGCFLDRRREGVELRARASEIGVSSWWLCQMEHGEVSDERLKTFMESRNRASSG